MIISGSTIEEFKDITRFVNPNQLTAFCGIDSSRNKSETVDYNEHMVKHWLWNLHYVQFNITIIAIIHNTKNNISISNLTLIIYNFNNKYISMY